MNPVSTRSRPRQYSPIRQASQPVDASSPAELIQQLASEMRTPVASVREAIQSIHDGFGGQVNQQQRAMLETAIQRCGLLDRMIGKLLQEDHNTSPILHLHRRQIDVTQIREHVDQLLMDYDRDQSIDILWDGADDPQLTVFADLELIGRMMNDLVRQSIRVTPPGGCVLIRLQNKPSLETVRMSVIDQGQGISEAQIQEIAEGHQPHGSDLAWKFCEQIAALHFSNLELYSRVGSGTEISFDLPRAQPRSIATVWTRWRTRQQPLASAGTQRASGVKSLGTGHQVRFDAEPSHLSLAGSTATARISDCFSAGTVQLGATVPRIAAEAFDRFLQRQIGTFDLVYRAGIRNWVWAFDLDSREADQRIESISELANTVIPAVRMDWSAPMVIPISGRPTEMRLSELMIRESLSETPAIGVTDKDSVRLGTEPMNPTSAGSDRVNEELQRLSNQLKQQTQRMRRQAHHLRPRVN